MKTKGNGSGKRAERKAAQNGVAGSSRTAGKKRIGALSCSVAILMSGMHAGALTVTWSGGHAGSSNWNQWHNWIGGSTPTSGTDVLVFDTSSYLSNTNDFPSNVSINGITFTAAAGPFILKGPTSNLLTVSGSVVNLSSNLQTLNLPLALASGTMVTFYDAGGGTSGSGTISGAGGLQKTGTGTLFLSATNSYSGATEIDAGVLSVSLLANGGANSAIGASGSSASNLVLAGGTLQYTDGTGTTNRSFTLNNGTVSGIQVANAAAVLTFSGTSAATTGGLNVSGPGTLVLSGTNYFTGPTTVLSGTLRILVAGALSGSPKVTVNSGATFDFDSIAGGLTIGTGKTLAGAGTVLGSSALTLGSGGDLAASGTLTLQTGLTLANGGGGQFDLRLGTASDLVQIASSHLFTPTTSGSTVFNLSGVSGFTKGATYTLLNWTGGTGPTSLYSNEFVLSAASQNAGMSGSFSISSSRLQFTVTTIPETSYAVLLPWGVGVIVLWSRRRRNWRNTGGR